MSCSSSYLSTLRNAIRPTRPMRKGHVWTQPDPSFTRRMCSSLQGLIRASCKTLDISSSLLYRKIIVKYMITKLALSSTAVRHTTAPQLSLLCSLPPEIRAIVYQHVFVRPFKGDSIRPVLAREHRLPEWLQDTRPETGALALLRTCHSVYTEASKIFYHLQRFCIRPF